MTKRGPGRRGPNEGARRAGAGDARGAAGAGSAPAWPERVQLLVDGQRLRPQAFSHAEVAAVWQKAVESARDAEIPAMSVDGALRAAYDAGHLGALALLAAHGLRTGGGAGHHEMAFYGAACLGYTDLKDLVPDSEEVRRLRKGSLYDPVIAGPADRQRALEWVRRTLPALRAAILAKVPSLAAQLAPYP